MFSHTGSIPVLTTNKLYMRLNTLVTSLSMDNSYKIINLTIDWCKVFFTPPHIKRRSELLVMVYSSESHESMGEFCNRNNWLTINLSGNSTVKDLIQTTIHEYTHHCQDLKEYPALQKKVGYDDNPYEVEARHNETTYYINCWRSIKRKI